jgi:hypothetical protein
MDGGIMLGGLLVSTLVVFMCVIGCIYKKSTCEHWEEERWFLLFVLFVVIFIALFSSSYIHINTIIANQLDLAILKQGI